MKKTIAIIGGGTSAIMLAAHLDEQKFDISIYEKNTALGRKFLVAGDGGFNLSHSEEPEAFISRYTPSSFFQKSISSFTNNDLREWLSSLGIKTYVGSSMRIFPLRGIKPIEVLNAILKTLRQKNIAILTQHLLLTWSNGELIFELLSSSGKPSQKQLIIKPDIVVFALGGASWKVTGSDGKWSKLFDEQGIKTIPFQASNCSYAIKWEQDFIEKNEGKTLKNISINCEKQEKKGELVITKFGLEGGAVYALSPSIRKQLKENGIAEITIDLKPGYTPEEIKTKLANRGNKALSKQLQNELNLNPTQLDLIKQTLTKEEFTNPATLASKIKAMPLKITNAAPINEAISTVGGISLAEVDANFQIKKHPNHYVIGEMLDWDAPTGGYLLQGCFSMSFLLANHLNDSF